MNDALLVALGAVPGAWLRFRLVNHLEPRLPRRHWGTLAVNLLACFALGLLTTRLTPFAATTAAERLWQLLAIGLLGSFSTFSTLMAELVQSVERGERRGAAVLLAGSLAGGVLALSAGQVLGR